MSKQPFKIEFYRDAKGAEPCRRWITKDLSQIQRQAVVAALRRVLAYQGISVCGSSFGRHIPGYKGLFEFRLNKDADEILGQLDPSKVSRKSSKSERILIRILCHAYGDKIVLLPGGYDKSRDTSKKRQQKEIKIAAKRLADFKRRA